jgi:hypothetical protein
MKRTWLTLGVITFAGAILVLESDQRQEVAKYIVTCLLLAFVIRPVGLTIGQIFRKVLDKD